MHLIGVIVYREKAFIGQESRLKSLFEGIKELPGKSHFTKRSIEEYKREQTLLLSNGSF